MKIVIMTGSIRKQRAADKVLATVKAAAEDRDGYVVSVADLREINLPMFDAELPPSHPDFKAGYDSVEAWRKIVADADALIMLTPEYNAGMSAAQKNAIDWLNAEWNGKVIAVVGYSWHGSPTSRKHLTDTITRIRAVEVSPAVELSFNKNIEPDGTVIDQSNVSAQLAAMFDALDDTMQEESWR